MGVGTPFITIIGAHLVKICWVFLVFLWNSMVRRNVWESYVLWDAHCIFWMGWLSFFLPHFTIPMTIIDKRNVVFHPSFFRGELLNFRGVYIVIEQNDNALIFVWTNWRSWVYGSFVEAHFLSSGFPKWTSFKLQPFLCLFHEKKPMIGIHQASTNNLRSWKKDVYVVIRLWKVNGNSSKSLTSKVETQPFEDVSSICQNGDVPASHVRFSGW